MPSTLGIVASGVWTPAELAPDLWLDAADTSTITESGGSVSQWDDKSGNGRNFTQATAANQPTTGTRTQNGLNVLDFDGSDDFLEGGDILDIRSGSVTMFVVVKLDSPPSTLTGIAGKTSFRGQTGRYAIFWLNNSHRALAQLEQGREIFSDPGVGDRDKPYVITAPINRNDALRLRRNESQVAIASLSGTTFYNSPDIWLVGAYGNSTGTAPRSGTFMDGFIGEIIVVMRTVTASELALTEDYLMSKWSI